jgi:Ca2+-transporting ATPase
MTEQTTITPNARSLSMDRLVPTNSPQPWALPVESVVDLLGARPEAGLTRAEAALRLQEVGANELAERPRPGFLRRLLDQLSNFLIFILIAAAVVSVLVGETLDALAIGAIVVLNSVLGVIQESKAEQALAALKKMAAPTASVTRDGRLVSVPARMLVPGDVVLLEAGNHVPADLRLTEAINLKVQEASLTGESTPVEKDAQAVLTADAPLGDRRNCAFMGTTVTYGRGRGLVSATGMRTQVGEIAGMLQDYDEEQTPLQKRLDQLGRWLGIAALGICGFIFVFGVVRDTPVGTLFDQGLSSFLTPQTRQALVELFMTAVGLAIAAVPEGLPAVVTICLALGMQRMVRRHALIRKLPAVETLGCATVICCDKTGTLTLNEMVARQMWADGKVVHIAGEGYAPTGDFAHDGRPFHPRSDLSASLLLYGGLLCNDASLRTTKGEAGDDTWSIVGDPTEGALVALAAKGGLWRDQVEKAMPRTWEIPFDSERKRMATVHRLPGGSQSSSANDEPAIADAGKSIAQLLQPAAAVLFVKGAPDGVLQLCEQILEDGRPAMLDDPGRERVMAANLEMASHAMRVLAVAYRPLDDVPVSGTPSTLERDLVFVGLVGMIDPPRPEVKAAIAEASTAGIRTLMVTGDYEATAVAVAREVGLLSPNGLVLSGAELDRMSADELAAVVDRVDVCARVSPRNKVQIVDALRSHGHVVAMTGDGVNDAPALKRADIGVAMGITGTDVAKETADVVLTDDNYASIVSAVDEGRVIYSNIRNFVFYLVSCNVGEILVIFISMVAGLPLPLRPIQLLWLNLVTDGAPALALGLEKGDPGIMKRPPRRASEPIINRDMRIGVALQSTAMTIAVLIAFLFGLERYPGNLAAAQTMAFITLVTSELLRAYTARSQHSSVFSIGLFSNPWMVRATVASFVLLLLVVYVPALQTVFSTVPLTPSDWLLMLPLFFPVSLAAELPKARMRRRAL